MNVIGLSEKKKYTYSDYLKTPEGSGFQLLNGEIMESPAPYFSHQNIVKKLFREMDDFVEDNKLGTVVFAPVDVYFDNENCVQPDILFISEKRKNIITIKNVQGPPDLVVEVVSGSKQIDTVKKKQLYEKYGVKEYWIVFPEQAAITVYSLTEKVYSLFGNFQKSGILHSRVLKGLEIELKNIF